MVDENIERWKAHAGVARLIRVGIVVVPFLASVAMAFALSTRLPIAESLAGRGLRLLVILVAATATMMLVDRLARRLLPLSALFHLTLIFPDQAPSRFKIALKTSGADDLEERITAAMRAPDGETPGEAAERLLELVGLLSHHDQITRGHSERVRAYTQILGEELGLTETELDKIRWAGLLHDVGKTTIPSEILNKPGELTDEEYAVIQGHPEAGRCLVEPLEDWLGDSLRAVWEHHERWDGTGYPRQLAGTDISMGARIVSVADTYDVITSARSYKRPLSAVEARAELARCAGEQFDPTVVRAFLNISLGKLRWMAGPSAWVAQLALFEPTGVVHAGDGGSSAGGVAGSSGAGSSTAGTVSATGTSTTAAAGSGVAAGTTASTSASVLTSAAAAGGSSGLVGTLAVVGVGVAAGTTGVVAADEPVPSESVIETAFVEDAGPAAGVDEPIVLGEGFAPRVTLVRETPGAGVGDDGDGFTGAVAPSDPVDVPSAASATETGDDVPQAGTAIDAADDDRAGGDADETAASPGVDVAAAGDDTESDGDGGDDSTSTDDDSDGSSTPVSATTTVASLVGSSGSSGSDGSGGSTVTTTVPTVPTTPTSPTVPSTTIPVTTVPSTTIPPTTVPSTTTPPTTVPPTTVPPPTTTTTLPPPIGSIDADATTFFLEGGSSLSPWWGTLGDVTPPSVPLIDLDVWGDGDPGLTLPRNSAGVWSVVPGQVAVFQSAVDSDLLLEGIESLELFVAADDFARKDVDVSVSLRQCSGWQCRTLATDDDEVRNADDFKKLELFDGVELGVLLEAGDVIELRIAVLGDSEAWGMLAFGTEDYDSHLELTIDDTV